MWLLDGVLVEVQAPRWVVQQQLGLSSSFCDCGLSNLGGYSFALVANDGSFKTQQSPLLIRLVDRQLGGIETNKICLLRANDELR